MRLLKLLFWLILILWALPCMAQTDIHRCIDANGSALFTDQTCAAMQATAVLPAPKPAAPVAILDAHAAAGIAVIPIAPPPILCAATFGKLRQSVIDAFAVRNANRMAGLMLWNGYGSETAVADIRALAALMQQPLLDARAPSSTDTTSDDEMDQYAADQDDTDQADRSEIVLHLAGNDGSGNPREIRYGIVRRYGCLWLRVGG